MEEELVKDKLKTAEGKALDVISKAQGTAKDIISTAEDLASKKTIEQHREIVDEIKKHVVQIIKETVNGKIDKLTVKVDEAISIAKASASTAYIASDANRKTVVELQKINETLKPFNDIKATGRVMKWIILTLTMITGLGISFKVLLTK